MVSLKKQNKFFNFNIRSKKKKKKEPVVALATP